MNERDKLIKEINEKWGCACHVRPVPHLQDGIDIDIIANFILAYRKRTSLDEFIAIKIHNHLYNQRGEK